jgi:hypothetical protein
MPTPITDRLNHELRKFVFMNPIEAEFKPVEKQEFRRKRGRESANQ